MMRRTEGVCLTIFLLCLAGYMMAAGVTGDFPGARWWTDHNGSQHQDSSKCPQ